ncbi:MAG: 2-oxoacid:ferredoxin oxidoreductase subunit beta [Thermodesulfovibrionales bacterium]|nr:2-oxoacid:ferredoxin oxidoreductase subunit beta [Thermodesulfovibrionales bacterium]MDP3110737.1 2-oxoacid:ferredoxin oxidoreductase subunit beta [Thermodesulfovibrionales bacterium]
MPTLDDYKGQTPTWCPGCGNFGILKTFKDTVVELGIEPHQLTVVSGIGQAGKFPHYLKCNTFNGLHGRTLPVATGIRLANHDMIVIAVAGDGDCYGEGGNHLNHAIRRNINVKLFVHDNQIYGLTKGQASPTSMEGMKTKNQPFGVFSEQLNPMALAVALDCSFVARGFAGDMEHLKGLMKEAINHKGFSLVDILQPCVTFNKINTYEWYRQRVYHIEPEYNPENRTEAFKRALEWGDRIPVGIIYRNSRQMLEERIPIIMDKPLVKQLPALSKLETTLKEFY